MKVKVKATGKIIDVRIHGMNANGKPISFYSLDGRDYFKAEELELESKKYETQDEWNSIYKAIEILCERVTTQTVKNDAYYNSLWSEVHKHLDTARGLLSTDKYDNKWVKTLLMKLIDKAALVAEIERLKSEYMEHTRDKFHTKWACGVLDHILSFLNTLEVREVDLEKEINDWYNTEASEEFENVLYKDIEKCAKHFFNLGLKAQKGEEV